MEFAVYDNLEMYDKALALEKGKDESLPVLDIWIKPPHNAFWFQTTYDKEERDFSVRDDVLHIHPNGTDISEAQFDKDPILIQKSWIKYDPVARGLEIKTSMWPWKKPIWTKPVLFYGFEDPHKKLPVLGRIMYNHVRFRMDFVLNYYRA